jgi:predicted MFS family arabinose efflux permease
VLPREDESLNAHESILPAGPPNARRDSGAHAASPSRGVVLILAIACGLLAANLYYAQPLAGPISAALRMPAWATGLVVTLTQMGYGTGLLLLVPLSDVTENRRLVLVMVGVAAAGLMGIAWFHDPFLFLFAEFCVGLGSSAIQVLVPLAAHMSAESRRGQVVGTVTAGLLTGIMLARPTASIVAELFNWRTNFQVSVCAMLLVALLLRWKLPRRTPSGELDYSELIVSMGSLAASTRQLRRRAIYQAFLFGAFSLFWTTVPLVLAKTFHLSQGGIALFSLAGVAGAAAAPIAGRLADRGKGHVVTLVAILAVGAAFLISRLAMGDSATTLAFLVIAAIVLDLGVSANLIVGQRAIFTLDASVRGRLNAVFMGTFFAGGAIGSALGGAAFAYGGWSFASWVGLVFPALALAHFAATKDYVAEQERSSR